MISQTDSQSNILSRSNQQRRIPAASADQLHKRAVSRAAGHSRTLGSSRADGTMLRRRRRSAAQDACSSPDQARGFRFTVCLGQYRLLSSENSTMPSDVTLLQPHNHILLLAKPQVPCLPCAVLVCQFQLEASQHLGCQLMQLSQRDILAYAGP